MVSKSNRFSRQEEINELFGQIGKVLERKVEALLIGGAVMLELGLKDTTKDIDIVCRSEEDRDILLASAKSLGFEIVGPEKRHKRLGLNRLAMKGGRNLDIFAGRISFDFCLSEAIWQRAVRARSFGGLIVRNASIGDIFIMKLIANRPGDAPDCSALAIAGLDFDAIYNEIEQQYLKDGVVEQKIWITYLEEGIGILSPSRHDAISAGSSCCPSCS